MRDADTPHTNDKHRLRVPVSEEVLDAHVHEAQIGTVRLRRRIETETVHGSVDVRQEQYAVKRVPVDRVVEGRQDPWYEGDILIVPVYEEEVVTTTRLVMREQLHIRRQERMVQQEIEEDLRREVVDVDEDEVADEPRLDRS